MNEDQVGLDVNIVLSDAVTLVSETAKRIQYSTVTSPYRIQESFKQSVRKISFYNGTKVSMKVMGAASGGALLIFNVNIDDGEDDTGIVAYANSLFRSTYLLDEKSERIAALDDLIVRFDNTNVAGLQFFVARTMIAKGEALELAGRNDDAINTFDNIIQKFGTNDDTKIKKLVHGLDALKARNYYKSGKYQDALKYFDISIQRLQSSTEKWDQVRRAKLLLEKSEVYNATENFEVELLILNSLVQEFQSVEEEAFPEIFVGAQYKIAQHHEHAGNFAEEIAVYEAIINKFGHLEDNASQSYTAKALVLKAFRLTKMKQFAASLAEYDAILDRTATATSPTIERIRQTSLENSAEISMFVEDPAQTLARIDKALDEIGMYNGRKRIHMLLAFMVQDSMAFKRDLCTTILGHRYYGRLKWDFEEIDHWMKGIPDNERLDLKKIVAHLKGEVGRAEIKDACHVSDDL